MKVVINSALLVGSVEIFRYQKNCRFVHSRVITHEILEKSGAQRLSVLRGEMRAFFKCESQGGCDRVTLVDYLDPGLRDESPVFTIIVLIP